MLKIVGFTLMLTAFFMLLTTMHDVLEEFSTHGATSKEILMVITTLVGAGWLTGVVWNILWG